MLRPAPWWRCGLRTHWDRLVGSSGALVTVGTVVATMVRTGEIWQKMARFSEEIEKIETVMQQENKDEQKLEDEDKIAKSCKGRNT